MARKPEKEPRFPRLVGCVVLVLIILALPLPAAFFYAGTEWIVSGIEHVPSEFVATYAVGLVVLLATIAVAYFREWREKPKK